MYIGTDLLEKSGLEEVIDKLDFTFSIRPESIPFTETYGINLNATEYTVYDIATESIRTVVSNLGDSSLNVKDISVDGRNITTQIGYNSGGSVGASLLTITSVATMS